MAYSLMVGIIHTIQYCLRQKHKIQKSDVKLSNALHQTKKKIRLFVMNIIEKYFKFEEWFITVSQ